MAECMVKDCGVKTEPGATYEDAHKVMQRHLTTHLIEELQGIRAALCPQEAADAPKQAQPEPDTGGTPAPLASPLSAPVRKPPTGG